MANFPVPTRDQVSESSQAQFDNLQKGLGFVPNLYATIAHSEHGLAKYLAFQGAKTSLSNSGRRAAAALSNCRVRSKIRTVMLRLAEHDHPYFALAAIRLVPQ